MDRGKFEETEAIGDGLGPIFNAQSCRECHQNPVTGSTSQVKELRAGHNDSNGNFVAATATLADGTVDRKSTRLNSSHGYISYAVFCLKKKNSTSTLASIKLRKCSSKIITSIRSLISGRLSTKSMQTKQLISTGRSASLQRTYKKSFTSISHSTRNKTWDGLIRVRNIRALNGRFNTSITHFFFIIIGRPPISPLFPYRALFR